jgi:2-oxopent-4-enoate hydratase
VIDEHADALFRAWRDAAPIEPPVETSPGLDVDDAYEIQTRWLQRRTADGARRVGRKVGLTSRVMQEMFGVHQPDFGVLFDEMVAQDVVDTSNLIAPRIEAEIAFRLAAPLSGDVSVEDVLAATEAVLPALEVVDSRIDGWRISIVDTIADNASSGLFVLGSTERAPSEVDLLGETVSMRVGDQEATGRGDAVLGHPAAAVAWLAKTLGRRGERLEAGEIVLPGAMAAALPIVAGDRVRASFGTLGDVEVEVT